MSAGKVQFAQIEFHGHPGSTRQCLEAIVRLIHFGDRIDQASLLTYGNEHCFLLSINAGDRVAIKSGFTSGYLGEGPRGLATVLKVLERHGAEIEEYLVPESILRAIDECSLRLNQLEAIDALGPRRPQAWSDYIWSIEGDRSVEDGHACLNDAFPPTLPYALLDARLTDLALSFSGNPDASLVAAYRRLEDLVRKRAGLDAESSTRLFAKAFQGDTPLLGWPSVDAGEQRARASLFDAVYRAYRNPRAHREPREDMARAVREFLLLNELFLLEGQSLKQEAAPDLSLSGAV